DDAGIDERRAGGGDDRRDVDHGFRAHGVAVDIDRFLVAGAQNGREALAQSERLAGGHDREDEIGRRRVLLAPGKHPGRARPRRAGVAASLETGRDLQPMLDQALADAASHHPGRNDCNDWGHDALLAGTFDEGPYSAARRQSPGSWARLPQDRWAQPIVLKS